MNGKSVRCAVVCERLTCAFITFLITILLKYHALYAQVGDSESGFFV